MQLLKENMSNARYGFTGFNSGIGDQVMTSSFPENFFKNYGIKLIDISKCWIFDHNPYTERDINADVILNHLSTQIDIINKKTRYNWKSDAEELCYNFNLPKMFLRRPRLYKYEDSITQKDLVVVHTTGRTVGSMSDHVIEQIKKNYDGYDIVQIGFDSDVQTPFKKLLNLNKWETAEIISKAAIFIGVNSGFYHIANCYPKVRKKIVLQELGKEQLEGFKPKMQSISTEWYDYNIEYFNTSEIDIGATNSYNIL
jgi:hypothetical protein